jgi:hypothetical protein
MPATWWIERALPLYLFSANGAFYFSLGQRPRDSHNIRPLALKARFIPAPICVGLTPAIH